MTEQEIRQALSDLLGAAIGPRADRAALRGDVCVELRGPDGELKARLRRHNVICTAGKNIALASDSSAKYLKQWSYICIGSGSTAANAADTALQTELTRASSTVSTPSAGTLQFQVTFSAGTGTGTITEYGLDSANSPSGAILSHLVSGTITKAAGDSLQVTYQLS